MARICLRVGPYWWCVLHIGQPGSVCGDASSIRDGNLGGFCAAHGAIDFRHLVGAWLIMSVVLIFVVGRKVFASGRVNHHRIVGAILVYLSIATTFVALFTFVGLLIPKAFSGMLFEDSPALATKVIYFSFVTLTSTGYGDIFPVHPVARSLCNFETILGQLYPATLLARLVSLEIEGRR
jgi:hypothetical protein